MPSLACTLAADDYATRLAWIASLNRTSLRSHRRVGGALTLIYAAEAAQQVHELERREQACGAFQQFQVLEGQDTVSVHVEVPVQAGDAAADLLADQRNLVLQCHAEQRHIVGGAADVPRHYGRVPL